MSSVQVSEEHNDMLDFVKEKYGLMDRRAAVDKVLRVCSDGVDALRKGGRICVHDKSGDVMSVLE